MFKGVSEVFCFTTVKLGWGYGYLEQTQYLRVFVAQLRKKIEDNPSKPTLLITESGIGYRFGD